MGTYNDRRLIVLSKNGCDCAQIGKTFHFCTHFKMRHSSQVQNVLSVFGRIEMFSRLYLGLYSVFISEKLRSRVKVESGDSNNICLVPILPCISSAWL